MIGGLNVTDAKINMDIARALSRLSTYCLEERITLLKEIGAAIQGRLEQAERRLQAELAMFKV